MADDDGPSEEPVRDARHRREIAALAIAAVAIPLAGWVFWALVLRLGPNDFHDYWLAGKLILQGQSPYDSAALAELARTEGLDLLVGGGYSYPLPFALAMVPFALLPFAVAVTAFNAISLALFGLTVAVWLGWAHGRAPAGRRRRLVTALAAGSVPAGLRDRGDGPGESGLFPLLAIGTVLALDGATSARRFWGGVLVGLAAIVKLVPAVFIAPLGLGRRFGAALGIAAGMVGALAAAARGRTLGRRRQWRSGLAIRPRRLLHEPVDQRLRHPARPAIREVEPIVGRRLRPAAGDAGCHRGLRPGDAGGPVAGSRHAGDAARCRARTGTGARGRHRRGAEGELLESSRSPWSRSACYWPSMRRTSGSARSVEPTWGFSARGSARRSFGLLVWAIEPPGLGPLTPVVTLAWSSSLYGLLALWFLFARRLRPGRIRPRPRSRSRAGHAAGRGPSAPACRGRGRRRRRRRPGRRPRPPRSAGSSGRTGPAMRRATGPGSSRRSRRRDRRRPSPRCRSGRRRRSRSRPPRRPARRCRAGRGSQDSRTGRIRRTSEPARPAETPTQPTANVSYGSHGPTPPVTSAETSSEKEPTRNPYDGPNS